MSLARLTLMSLALVTLAAPIAHAADASTATLSVTAETAGISIDNAYSFATSAKQENGAVFLTVKNTGKEDDRLVSASSAVAKSLEIHTMTMEGDVMQMRKVDSFDLPAGKDLVLDPNGNHIMLMGLNAPLTEGQTFPLTLTFEKGGEKTVEVSVRAPGSAGEDESHDHSGHSH